MIAVFGGLILLTDLRLLNVAMKSIPASLVVAQDAPVEVCRPHDHASTSRLRKNHVWLTP